MFNLRYICFNARIYVWGSLNEKLHANGVDIVYLSNELRYLWWEYYPFKSLSSSFNPRNLVVLKLYNGNVEQLWNEDKYQDLRNLREIDVSFCKNLRKIPNLLGAVNLKRINCIGCTSLVELPCLNDLASLESLQLFGCVNLRKIPDLFGAINLKIFNCGGCTSLVELPCLCHSTFLKDISLQDCPKLKKFRHMSSNIPKLESVRRLGVPNCKALESLPELPPYMLFLEAEGCASLERVEFTDHNLNQFDSLDDDANKQVFLSFFDCFGLSQDSIKNIQTNAMLQIRYLAQRLIRAGRYQRKSNLDSIFYCFPGNEISTNEFEHLSQNSSLNLKIALNGRSGSRFLAFAICLVPDLTQCPILSGLEFNCKYQLTAASGEEFRSEFMFLYRHGNDLHYTIDHVFIPFGEDMIVKDNDYEAASFDFNIHMRHGREKFEVNVKKCGVHVFYVDAESFVVSAATEIINFSYIGGEKGKGGAKRWKYFDFL
ncbi:hypothetical protein V6N12_019554 [Hibiscus sabdariffa]|uniref:Uncharacterized protein n=1 Tax=Hibiscus sabdariffa TaxID=183260 RepID=A0ABR2BP59_9ROSI